MKTKGSAKCRTGSFFLALIMLFTAFSVNYVDANAAKAADVLPETVAFTLTGNSNGNTNASLRPGDMIKFVFDKDSRPDFVFYKTGAKPWNALDIDNDEYDVLYTFLGDDEDVNSCEYQIPADAVLGEVYSFGALWASDVQSMEELNPALIKPVAEITVAEEKSEYITAKSGENITADMIPAQTADGAPAPVLFTGSVIEDETRLQAMQENFHDFEVKGGAYYDLHAEGFSGAVRISVQPENFTLGENDTVSVIHFPNSAEGDYTEYEYLPCSYEGGVVTFEADAFSDFWVAYGKNTTSFTATRGSLDIYAYPGMAFTVSGIREWNREISVNETKDGITCTSLTNSNNQGKYFVSSDAVENSQVDILTRKVYPETYKITVHILSYVDYFRWYFKSVSGKPNTNANRLLIACIKDVSGGLPSEPTDSTQNYKYYDYKKYTTLEEYLNFDFLNSNKFECNTSKTAVGIFDQTGDSIKPFFKDFASVEKEILSNVHQMSDVYVMKGSQKVLVSEMNIDQLKVVPYILKFKDMDDGWHVDCYITLKDAVELTYDLNLPNGFVSSSTIPMPGGESAVPTFSASVAGLSALSYSGTMNGAPAEIMFLGWSTTPSGTVVYYPGDSIIISENTTLYAIWSSSMLPGTLVVSKTVTADDGVKIPDDAEFEFKIEGTVSGSYSWTKVKNGLIQDRGIWSPGGTINLKADERIEIDGFAHDTKLTVSEIVPTNSGFTPEKNDISVIIQGAQKREAAFVNKYSAPTANLTIQKQYPNGADYTIDENQIFLFRIQGTDENTQAIDLTVSIQGDKSTTIADLPAGRYTVTECTDWSWRYTPDNKVKTIVLISGGDNTVSFKNTRAKDLWLDGNACKDNVFNS